jgi:hypothetical protein
VSELPVRLDQLATQIEAKHRAAQEAARSAVEHACRAGELLIEAKAAVTHGKWGRWIEANVTIAPRTVRAYMQLAKRLPELSDADRQRVADLPVRYAVKEVRALQPIAPAAPARPLPPAERVAREWERGRERAAQAVKTAVQLLEQVRRLPIPEKVDDFKAWASALLKLGSDATMAGQDMERWPRRIENPPLDPHEVTYVTVKLAPPGAELPDLTREELALALSGDDAGRAVSYQSDARDMLIMKFSNWCLDAEPPGEGWWRWALLVQRPGEPLWARGFWSRLGESTALKQRDDSLRAHTGHRPGWVAWGNEA